MLGSYKDHRTKEYEIFLIYLLTFQEITDKFLRNYIMRL